jgi:hypothetical protein
MWTDHLSDLTPGDRASVFDRSGNGVSDVVEGRIAVKWLVCELYA